ncbi:MAG: phosphate acyltransferase PlsX [Caldilineaceae bacterium SB0668_bin_21]|nr:phosphate acyltransferase PlsX [Caldilineaceae bacterium]MXX24309.1 phosphate acyltransferase PlsX [Caldilineaceae bacterium SB0668_bin_21]MYC24212.1 phosphate acyltransferase PlsX [Caldilineaceae bacterium SB0662_bin_25]
MNIALDVMGGDNAPHEIVSGAILAARQYDVTVSLVGRPDVIERELARHPTHRLDLPIVPAYEVIEMSDKPVKAVRTKKNSSMVVACQLVKEGKADAFVTAGNTGGALAAGILHFGRMQSILRPALIVPFPTLKGFCLILDVGANTDVKPEQLQQFGVMGSVYSRRIMGVRNPSVRILSNGEEEGKGNQLVLEATALLEETPGIRFMGNIEARDVTSGIADVVVTDGFTGNVFMKGAEGIVKLLQGVLLDEITAGPISSIGGLLVRSALRRMARRLDDSEFGGAVLLGLSNLMVVGHGRSNANAIRHTIRNAKQLIDSRLVEEIQSGVSEVIDSQEEVVELQR